MATELPTYGCANDKGELHHGHYAQSADALCKPLYCRIYQKFQIFKVFQSLLKVKL